MGPGQEVAMGRRRWAATAAAAAGVLGAVMAGAALSAPGVGRTAAAGPYVAYLPQLSNDEPHAGGASPSPTSTASATATATATATANGPVEITFVLSPVARGGFGEVHARTTPGAACSFVFAYRDSAGNKAITLNDEADDHGLIVFSWRIPNEILSGTWDITVSCGTGHASATLTI